MVCACVYKPRDPTWCPTPLPHKGLAPHLPLHSHCVQRKSCSFQTARPPQRHCATPQDKPLVHASNWVSRVAPSPKRHHASAAFPQRFSIELAQSSPKRGNVAGSFLPGASAPHKSPDSSGTSSPPTHSGDVSPAAGRSCVSISTRSAADSS